MGRAGVGLVVGALLGAIAADLSLSSLLSLWDDPTYRIVAAAAAGALLWLTPLRRVVGALLALLVALWLAVSYTPLTARLRDGLVRRDTVREADAVFVFSSRVQPDGDPTPDAMSRLLKGVELLAEGRAPHLVVSELPRPAGRYAPTARAWVGLFAPRGGDVADVGVTLNTHDEALALARLCHERGWKRVLAVTSPTHTRRAAATLEKQGIEVVSVPATETRFDLEQLDWPQDRREAFGAIAHERLGLLVYRYRGWIE